MRAAIYSPYLDTLGGGEKYMMTIAEVLSRQLDVDVLLDEHLDSLASELKTKLSERFSLNIDKVNFIRAPVGKSSSFFKRSFFLRRYNILFYLTDGSIFYPTAKRNILHIQSPLVGQPAKSLWGRIKLRGWDLIIFNSNFTKKHSEKNWPLRSQVVFPPVDIDKIKPLKKEKIILSVGRFFGYLEDKKHKVMIDTFKDLYISNKLAGWSLYLVGSASEGDKPYLDELRSMIKNLPIKFYPNLNYSDLIRLYGKSRIYWHAAGFGEEDPTRMEHFGISTVEAMAGGCVPVVINKGGQTEIVENGKTGFLWDSLKDLEKFTLKLIKDENLRFNLSQAAILSSHKFSKIRFEKEIIEAVKQL